MCTRATVPRRFFSDDENVLTLSVHCKNNFPLRKQKSRIDVELDAGIADDAYLNALAEVLPKVVDFRPEVIFYQSGVDGLAEDRLGKLAANAPRIAGPRPAGDRYGRAERCSAGHHVGRGVCRADSADRGSACQHISNGARILFPTR